MPNLWEPSNIHAPPNPSEIKLVKECIQNLEVQLQSALDALLEAQRAVIMLQQQIDVRKAWIAPIRRVPQDVLSLIFLETCRMDALAPLMLGQVCRLWRDYITAYPKAWSFFQFKCWQSNELKSLFISRSAPCLLHLRPEGKLDSHSYALLASVTERMQCITLDIDQILLLRDHQFPALERLHFYGGPITVPAEPEIGFLLNSDSFPRLRLLAAHTKFVTFPWKTPPFPNCVSLQAFSVTTGNPEVWSMIVECSRDTLTSLSVTLYSDDVDISILNRKAIVLPRLEQLAIEIYAGGLPIPWAIDAKTPVLQTYFESSMEEDFVGPIHGDTESVTSLHFTFDIDLSKFPEVRRMWFSADALDTVVDRLMEAPQICPNLETILDDRLGGDSLTRAKELISARNKQTGGNIQFQHEGSVIHHDGFPYRTEPTFAVRLFPVVRPYPL